MGTQRKYNKLIGIQTASHGKSKTRRTKEKGNIRDLLKLVSELLIEEHKSAGTG